MVGDSMVFLIAHLVIAVVAELHMREKRGPPAAGPVYRIVYEPLCASLLYISVCSRSRCARRGRSWLAPEHRHWQPINAPITAQAREAGRRPEEAQTRATGKRREQGICNIGILRVDRPVRVVVDHFFSWASAALGLSLDADHARARRAHWSLELVRPVRGRILGQSSELRIVGGSPGRGSSAWWPCQ